ncbi:MAG: hypothetical protein WBI55_05045 [Eubacteriales bacterium]
MSFLIETAGAPEDKLITLTFSSSGGAVVVSSPSPASVAIFNKLATDCELIFFSALVFASN